MMENKTRRNQEQVYRELYQKHKEAPMAVSSKSKARENLRDDKKTNITEDTENLSVHDVGM